MHGGPVAPLDEQNTLGAGMQVARPDQEVNRIHSRHALIRKNQRNHHPGTGEIPQRAQRSSCRGHAITW